MFKKTFCLFSKRFLRKKSLEQIPLTSNKNVKVVKISKPSKSKTNVFNHQKGDVQTFGTRFEGDGNTFEGDGNTFGDGKTSFGGDAKLKWTLFKCVVGGYAFLCLIVANANWTEYGKESVYQILEQCIGDVSDISFDSIRDAFHAIQRFATNKHNWPLLRDSDTIEAMVHAYKTEPNSKLFAYSASTLNRLMKSKEMLSQIQSLLPPLTALKLVSKRLNDESFNEVSKFLCDYIIVSNIDEETISYIHTLSKNEKRLAASLYETLAKNKLLKEEKDIEELKQFYNNCKDNNLLKKSLTNAMHYIDPNIPLIKESLWKTILNKVKYASSTNFGQNFLSLVVGTYCYNLLRWTFIYRKTFVKDISVWKFCQSRANYATKIMLPLLLIYEILHISENYLYKNYSFDRKFVPAIFIGNCVISLGWFGYALTKTPFLFYPFLSSQLFGKSEILIDPKLGIGYTKKLN